MKKLNKIIRKLKRLHDIEGNCKTTSKALRQAKELKKELRILKAYFDSM